jgi:hypothetical protein
MALHFSAMRIKKAMVTHLGVREISICKNQMLLACISGIEVLESLSKFASSSEQVTA